MASAAYAAEDLIESHVVDHILTGYCEETSPLLCDLQKVIEDMDSIKKRAMEIVEMRGLRDVLIPTSSRRAPPTGKSAVVVGFDVELIQIMERLAGQESSRQVIPIVGVGGIGKTTLARAVYADPFVEEYFHVRIWVTISQDYTLRYMLLQIPICQDKKEDERSRLLLTDDELGEELYKSLFGRRYLIVMDDMWSIEAWDGIKFFFPDNGNMSRIIVTTRLENVALHFGSCDFKMGFLNEDKSWNLFREIVFAHQGCPHELEKTGKEIVEKCKGLPLSIVAVGGFLAKSYWTRDYWESVAEDIKSILNSEDDEYCLNLLLQSKFGRCGNLDMSNSGDCFFPILPTSNQKGKAMSFWDTLILF